MTITLDTLHKFVMDKEVANRMIFLPKGDHFSVTLANIDGSSCELYITRSPNVYAVESESEYYISDSGWVCNVLKEMDIKNSHERICEYIDSEGVRIHPDVSTMLVDGSVDGLVVIVLPIAPHTWRSEFCCMQRIIKDCINVMGRKYDV